MIDKIKAQIERIDHDFDRHNQFDLGSRCAFEQCLKWAEELEKKLLFESDGEDLSLSCKAHNQMIRKAFHGESQKGEMAHYRKHVLL